MSKELPKHPHLAAAESTGFERILAGLALPGLLTIPAMYLLVFHDYPLWRAETLLLLASPLVLGVGTVRILKRFPALWRVFTLIAFGYTLIYMTSRSLWLAGQPNWLKLFFLVAPAVLAALLIVKLREKGLAIVGGGTMAFIAALLMTGTPRVLPVDIDGLLPPGNNALPPILHIVLDEHTGLTEIPHDSVPAMTSALVDFRTYPDAFNSFSVTPLAMATVLNQLNPESVPATLEYHGSRWELHRNDWFESWKKLGYKISVHHPLIVDYCETPGMVDRCYTYNPFSLANIDDLEIGTLRKWQTLSNRLLSPLFKADHGDGLIPAWPQCARTAIEDFLDLAATEARGHVYFLHLTIPHHPFLFDDECKPRGNKSKRFDDAPGVEAADESKDAYFQQMNCAWLQLQRVLDTIALNADFSDATILIHGDHGRRHSSSWTVETGTDPSTLDGNDLFATLFAVRRPGLSSGAIRGRISLQRGIAALSGECEDRHTTAATGYAVVGDGRLFRRHPTPEMIPVPLPDISFNPALPPCVGNLSTVHIYLSF